MTADTKSIDHLRTRADQVSEYALHSMWKSTVAGALREAKSLRVFCEGHIQYGQYQAILDDLIRVLEMEAVTGILSDKAVG
jgi:hypothetical protein